MFHLTLVACAIALLCGVERGLAAQVTLSDELKTLIKYAPRPEYPYEARVKHLTGRGMVLLNVDSRTGHVTSAQMLETTGHKVLDDAALNAFQQWQLKPGTASYLRIPITFTLQGARAQVSGMVLVDVDSSTGHVTSARMLQSTGFQALDEAALKEFRKWRFRPGTVPKVRIPITFDILRTR